MAAPTTLRALTEDELKAALKRQISHLRRSAAAYDAGIEEEAERLSAVAYILLADGRPPIVSLLEQLKLRSSLQFVASGSRSGTHIGMPLCDIEVTGPDEAARYRPFLDGSKARAHFETQLQSFDVWWNGAVYRHSRTGALTRRGLIFALRHQDGGAHVDAGITDAEYDMMKSIGWDQVHIKDGRPNVTIFGYGGKLSDEDRARLRRPPYRGNPPISGGHWATMRQIAWELDRTLQSIGY